MTRRPSTTPQESGASRLTVAVGETLQRLREARGLSLRTLAGRAGFSPSFLSQVENGQTSPSIASLARLAECLGIGLAAFFDEAGGDDATFRGDSVVVRRGTRRNLTSEWSRAEVEPLVPQGVLSHLEGLLVTLAPGGRSGKRPSPEPVEQLALVLDGELDLTLGDEIHRLGVGDAAAIPAGVRHLWGNPGEGSAKMVLMRGREALPRPGGSAPATEQEDVSPTGS